MGKKKKNEPDRWQRFPREDSGMETGVGQRAGTEPRSKSETMQKPEAPPNREAEAGGLR